MASQPANTDIKVFYSVRSQRDPIRHESVAALTKRLRPLVMSVPGEEILVGVLARDTAVSDFSPFMGEARYGAGRGFPIVIGLLKRKAFADAQEGLTGIDFAFTIGQDKFLQNTEANLSRDLHSDLRNDSLVAANA